VAIHAEAPLATCVLGSPRRGNTLARQSNVKRLSPLRMDHHAAARLVMTKSGAEADAAIHLSAQRHFLIADRA